MVSHLRAWYFQTTARNKKPTQGTAGVEGGKKVGEGIKSSRNQHSALSPSFLDNESIVFLLSCDVKKKKNPEKYLIYNKVIIWFIFMLTT